MQHCNFCDVDVAGQKECCPLCAGTLSGQGSLETELFPALHLRRGASVFVLRLLALLGITASVICVMINFTVTAKIFWSLFVVAGSVSTWLAAYIGLRYRRDVIQNITWEVFLLSAVTLLFDYFTGWYGWSLDFVLPSLCMVGLLTVLVLAVFMHISIHAVAPRALLLCLFGILCGALALAGQLKIMIVALICMGMSIAILTFMVIFHWQTIKSEFVKRFHL